MKISYLVIIVLVLIGVAALWGPIVSNVEQAKYQVFQSFGAIEIRDYAPMIVAEVEVAGERQVAINEGFRSIADYIFGNNLSTQKIAMTAPVRQQASEKIAMTAPVTQQSAGAGKWVVQFVMPSQYTMQTLPQPKNPAIRLQEIPSKRFVVIRFSGLASESQLKIQQDKLQNFIKDHGFTPIGSAIYAFFNPPWTLPFLRRNEIMLEIKK